MGSHLILGLGIAITAMLTATGALLFLFVYHSARRSRAVSIFNDGSHGTMFLFDDRCLVDSTPGGRAVLAASPAPGDTWAKFLAQFSSVFPKLEAHMAALPELGMVALNGEDSDGLPLMLRAEMRGGLTKISIHEAEGERQPGPQDPMAHRAVSEELAMLRNMLTQAPIMTWRENDEGAVVWANTEYVLAVAETLPQGQDLSWPLPRLFERTATEQAVDGQRQKILRGDGSVRWFELRVVDDGAARRVYALPCDAAVAAETNLREFMQTLTKTFAHLPTGLAIFDQQHRLQLFNPALLELTGLPPDFLSLRPTVVAMLDAMRDRNMLPEPRDYRRWRQHLIEMKNASVTGIYEETWSLAGGQTYRVVGRPQPNGSLALMFEDITGEISRTRRYKADIEMGQSVIDAMEAAVVVFSETGHLVMSNRAYANLWGNDPLESLEDAGVTAAVALWQTACAPTPLWSDIKDFIGTIGDKEGWQAEARLLDGRLLHCRIDPVFGGSTMLTFGLAEGVSGQKDTKPRQSRQTA